MPKITSFNQVNYPAFEAALHEAMEKVAAGHGVNVSFSPSRVSSTDASFTVRLATSMGEDLKAKTWNMVAAKWGFKPEHFGRRFVFKGRTYTALSITPGRVRYPLDAERDDGKRFKFPAGDKFPYQWLEA